MRRAVVFVLAAAGCKARIGGAVAANDGGAPECLSPESNQPPATPDVALPAAGRIDVLPESLVLAGSAFADADGDAQAGAEFEVWLAPNRTPATRVWSAATAGATSAALGDGAWDAPFDALDEWTDYAVRVRYRDASGACNDLGGWSGWRFFRTDDGSSYLFDPDAIHTFELDIPPATWDAVNAEAIPPECVQFERSYYPATLTFAGEVFDGVGLRSKGGCGSARDLSGKAAFKINLGWDDPDVPGCPEERKLYGQSHITLNNGIQDPTQEHERMAYRFYRTAGVPAPRAATAEVMVNGEWWGPYVHVESISRRFLHRWFPQRNGMLYEGSYWCDLYPWNVPASIDESSCMTREFKGGPCDPPNPGDDPTDWSLLLDLTNLVIALPDGGFYPEVEAFFAFDPFLTMWAIEGVIAHWDAYSFHIINNYRVYHDPSTDRWTMIPWGLDQTFLGDIDWDTGSPTFDLDPWSSDAVLVNRCLGEPDCEAAFAGRLREVNDLFDALDFRGEAEAIRAQIQDLILADPRREYDEYWYAQSHDFTVEFIEGRHARILEHLAAHGF